MRQQTPCLLFWPSRGAFRLPSVLIAGLLAGACDPPPSPVPRPPDIAGPSPRVEAMKHDLVEQLAQCESGGQSIYSSGGVYVGPMQFHRGTVVAYYKILYGLQITHKDAVEIAMDPDRAKQLTKDVIFTSGNKVRD